MTVPILNSCGWHIRINPLEIASNILNNFEYGVVYSIKINVDYDSHFITDGGDLRGKYFISKSGYITQQSHENEFAHEMEYDGSLSHFSKSISLMEFTDELASNIFKGRITDTLKKIGCKIISSDAIDNKILITFKLDYITKDEYRDALLKYVRKRIDDQYSKYTVEEIERGVWNTIKNNSQIVESTSLIVSNKDFGTLLNRSTRGPAIQEKDVIDILNIIYSADILTYVLYVFLYQGKLSKIEEDGNTFKIELVEENLIIPKEKIGNRIGFNEDNGVVTYDGVHVAILEGTDKLFFQVLFEDCRNKRIMPEVICRKMKKEKFGENPDYFPYLRQRLHKLPDQIRSWINNGPDGYILNDK